MFALITLILLVPNVPTIDDDTPEIEWIRVDDRHFILHVGLIKIHCYYRNEGDRAYWELISDKYKRKERSYGDLKKSAVKFAGDILEFHLKALGR